MDSVNVLWFFTIGVSPFGNLRIEAHLQLPAAYRSLSRPSSAPIAKAFSLRSFLLDLVGSRFLLYSVFKDLFSSTFRTLSELLLRVSIDLSSRAVSS